MRERGVRRQRIDVERKMMTSNCRRLNKASETNLVENFLGKHHLLALPLSHPLLDACFTLIVYSTVMVTCRNRSYASCILGT